VENVEEFDYLASMITNDARCTREMKAGIAMAIAAFNRKNFFTSKLDLELRKKLVTFYIWSIALYGAETWTLQKLDQKNLESFEMWCWRRMEKISWTDRLNNEAVLHRVKLRIALFGELRLEEAMNLSQDRLLLDLINYVYPMKPFLGPISCTHTHTYIYISNLLLLLTVLFHDL
jgi:hypothetical protein